MRTFFVSKDFDVEIRKGEDGIFQVITVLDEDKNDLSGKVGSGLFFKNDEELVLYLKQNLGIPRDEIVHIYEDK